MHAPVIIPAANSVPTPLANPIIAAFASVFQGQGLPYNNLELLIPKIELLNFQELNWVISKTELLDCEELNS